MFLIYIFNLEKYYKSDMGSNCPAQHIIKSEYPCTMALFQFYPLAGYNGAITDTRYPAGCSWDWRGDFTFNSIIDPSQTEQEFFRDKGGLCMNQGKLENDHFLEKSLILFWIQSSSIIDYSFSINSMPYGLFL